MADAKRDQNRVTSLLAVSNADGVTPVVLWADPFTHRLLVDLPGGAGTVTDVSVVTANGFAGTVADPTTTPAITLSTTVTGIIKGNGTAMSAAVANTDYQVPVVLTTTGTSGAATFNGTTLNIPQYQSAGNYANTALSNLASVAINTALLPDADNSIALGDATHNWSDLSLGTGALINFANGNSVITHSSGVLTVSTGDFRVTTAGSDATSVVTVGGTQTLTNKTLTSPTINTATVGGATQLAEDASIRLDATLSGDGHWSGITIAGTAGATLAFGDLIYKDPTDSRWELADANSAAGADGDARGTLGLCVLAAASDGDPTVILLYGNINAATAFPSMTINAQQYVSETAGDITGTQPVTTDAVIRVVGVALTADELLFNPSPDYITHT